MKKKTVNTGTSLKVNIGMNLLYEVLAVISPLITTPYVSRVLQADGIGINSYVSSLMTFFTLFAALGTTNYGKRTIASLRNDTMLYSKAFWEIELVTVITTSICLVLWIGFSLLYAEYRTYMLVLSFSLLATMFDISWLYGGLEQFRYTVVINSLCKVLSVICIFLFVRGQNAALIYTAILSLSTLLGTASMWLFVPKFVVKVNKCTLSLQSHFKETLCYFGPSIATSLYTVLDKTLIGIITDNNTQNGYYEQAAKIINIVKSICFNAINGVMISRASFFHSRNDHHKLAELRDTTYHLVSLLSCGACFGIIGVADIFVPVFFGEGYTSVIILLKLLAAVVLIIGLSSVANTIYYIAGGYMKKALRLILVGSVINFVLNIILIPMLEALGAVIATLLAESAITILFINGTDGFIRWKNIVTLIQKKICAGIIMLCVLRTAVQVLSGMNAIIMLCVEIVIGVVVYFSVLLLLKDESVVLGLSFVKAKMSRKGINDE